VTGWTEDIPTHYFSRYFVRWSVYTFLGYSVYKNLFQNKLEKMIRKHESEVKINLDW
jgi:uncharacterized membrane protein